MEFSVRSLQGQVYLLRLPTPTGGRLIGVDESSTHLARKAEMRFLRLRYALDGNGCGEVRGVGTISA
jgi:hypothetical protein